LTKTDDLMLSDNLMKDRHKDRYISQGKQIWTWYVCI